MKKQICIVILIILCISKVFAQDNPSKKPVILPKDAVEVGTSATGGTFAMFTEGGKIYSDGKVCTMDASAMCYGDKATLEMYTAGIIGVNFIKDKKTIYNDDRVKNPGWCCFKSESFGGGTLVSWTGKFKGGKDIGEMDTTTSYYSVLNWQGIKDACVINLYVTLGGKESVKACEAKAKAYLNEMITNAKKTDFTKL